MGKVTRVVTKEPFFGGKGVLIPFDQSRTPLPPTSGTKSTTPAAQTQSTHDDLPDVTMEVLKDYQARQNRV